MRTASWLLAVAMILIAAAPVMAGEPVLPPTANKAVVEKNLLIGLASDNVGLQKSSALMLGKIRADGARIPLMAALHNSCCEDVRMAAAWALCRIGHAFGTTAVKRAVSYDESNRVQVACAWYYENYVQKGTFVFRQAEEKILAELPRYE
jgi:hypothetical protein